MARLPCIELFWPTIWNECEPIDADGLVMVNHPKIPVGQSTSSELDTCVRDFLVQSRGLIHRPSPPRRNEPRSSPAYWRLRLALAMS